MIMRYILKSVAPYFKTRNLHVEQEQPGTVQFKLFLQNLPMIPTPLCLNVYEASAIVLHHNNEQSSDHKLAMV